MKNLVRFVLLLFLSIISHFLCIFSCFFSGLSCHFSPTGDHNLIRQAILIKIEIFWHIFVKQCDTTTSGLIFFTVLAKTESFNNEKSPWYESFLTEVFKNIPENRQLPNNGLLSGATVSFTSFQILCEINYCDLFSIPKTVISVVCEIQKLPRSISRKICLDK